MRSIMTVIAGLSVPATALAATMRASDIASGPEAKGVIDVVLQHGITGAMLLIVLYGYYRKDKQFSEESAARIADSKANGEVMRSLVVATTTQMERFNDTAEALVNELRAERHASNPGTTGQHRPITRPGGGGIR